MSKEIGFSCRISIGFSDKELICLVQTGSCHRPPVPPSAPPPLVGADGSDQKETLLLLWEIPWAHRGQGGKGPQQIHLTA